MTDNLKARLAAMQTRADDHATEKADLAARKADALRKHNDEQTALKAAWEDKVRMIAVIVAEIRPDLPSPFRSMSLKSYNTGRPDTIGGVNVDLEYGNQQISMHIAALTNGGVSIHYTDGIIEGKNYRLNDIDRDKYEDLIVAFMEAAQNLALRS